MGYRGLVEKQNQARDLRVQGWTLTEICEAVGCSKASASLWCRDVAVDAAVLDARRRARHLAGNEGARRRGPNKLQRLKQTEIEDMRAAGEARMAALTSRELLAAGVALYAGEGSKTDGTVSFANSDPRMVLFFVTWLRRFFDIDEARLRFSLYLHQGLDLDAAFSFWSDLTAIPIAQFRKPYRAVPDPSIRRSKHPMGCGTVAYSSATAHREIMGMIDALLTSVVSIGGPGPAHRQERSIRGSSAGRAFDC
jgi:hypothetical protein